MLFLNEGDINLEKKNYYFSISQRPRTFNFKLKRLRGHYDFNPKFKIFFFFFFSLISFAPFTISI